MSSTEERPSLVPGMPRKRQFRQRAHCNPLSDRDIPYPLSPDEIDWTEFYPILSSADHGMSQPFPAILDIGCGYGGLSFKMGKHNPHDLVLAFEIRCTVTNYVQKKIQALRQVGEANNVAVQWGNTMRTLMRYIRGNTIDAIFILFPDPHFKKRKAKWRIISPQLMDEYAFIMKDNATLYLVTDVQSYFEFAVPVIEGHPLFERLPIGEEDEVLRIAMTATEESKKVTRNGGRKFPAAFRRVARE
jgi:tRNA (guanine-N7-)-methyltransferase